MGDLHLQIPRTLSPPSLASPLVAPGQPPLLFPGLKCFSSPPPPSSSELVNFSDSGDFYHSFIDNSFSPSGILRNERRFSCSSPPLNLPFLPETSFSALSPLKNTQDRGIPNDNFGLLTTAINSGQFCIDNTNGQFFPEKFSYESSPTGDTGELPQEKESLFLPPIGFPSRNGNQYRNQLNDSGLTLSSIGASNHKWDSSPRTSSSTANDQFDQFSISMSDSSFSSNGTGERRGSNDSNGSNGSDASADSESFQTRFSDPFQGLAQQWNLSDISALLDNQPAESSSSSGLTSSTLGNTIWGSPSTLTVGSSDNTTTICESFEELSLEKDLVGLSKKKLMELVEVFMKAHEDCKRNGDQLSAERLQALIVQVQKYLITALVAEQSDSDSSDISPISLGPSSLFPSTSDQSLDQMARMHRDIAGSKDAPCTWSGQLPPRIHRPPVTYSSKVFLGGLPFDITETGLMQAFKSFGIMRIEWPGKDMTSPKIKGYAYAVFEGEKQVKALLQNCTQDFSSSPGGSYYYKVSSKRLRFKDVQVIPWALSDSNFVKCQASKIDPLKTVFVGALHGMVNAEGLAHIMDDLFGGVVYAGVDTDRSKYPIGSARVTFNNIRSYMKAVTAAYVLIKTARITKKVQIDPYLEDAICSFCGLQQGPYFCRDPACFNYFCRTCFYKKHADATLRNHRPMMRTASNKLGPGHGSSGKFNNNSNAFAPSTSSSSAVVGQGLQYAFFNNHGNNNGNNHSQAHIFGNSQANFYNNFNRNNGSANNRGGLGNNCGRYQPWSNGSNGRVHTPILNNTGNMCNGEHSPIGLNANGTILNGSGTSKFTGSWGNNNNGGGHSFPLGNSGVTTTSTPEFVVANNGGCQHGQQYFPPYTMNGNTTTRNFSGYRQQQLTR